MDRALGKNLEALAEEDDEEEEEATERSNKVESNSDSDSDSDSDGDDLDEGLAQREPNKFDGLCDGVLNAMSLVHVSLLELLELKDELLTHSLPPTLLVNLALTSAKVFRSISDMNMPVNELVRLVRVYSTPWEEKSAALKKLHEDYESKQRQLNIAIKRLQLVDAHSKRIAREKRIMNWEKLFSKVTTTKGHGRRWKFLIETIKQKAKLGLEHVQEYTKALEQASDSEEGEEEIVDTTKATESSPEAIDVISEKTEEETTGSRGDKDEDDGGEESESGSDSSEEKEVPAVVIDLAEESEEDETSDILSRSASPKKVRFDEGAPPPVIKPPMRDTGVDTEDPDYDNYLHVRIFCPEDMNHRGLKCSVTYGDQMYKTGILDWDEEEPAPAAEVPKATPRPQAAGRGRTSPASKVSAAVEEDEGKQRRYEEFMVRLPDEIPRGAVVFDKSIKDAPQNLQIAVHHGQFEEIIAMATLELSDLKELDLRTVYLPPPKGDDDVPRGAQTGRDDDLLSLSDSVDLSFPDDESDQESQKPREDPVKGVDPLPFPLFSLHARGSDAGHMSCGNLPLILYWGKRRRPPVFNRQTGTLGINEVVFDLTGIDLNTTTKEDLHKDMRDQALSAIDFTPEPQEETVAKTEVDELQKKHAEEMEEMKDSYEKQLKSLLESIAQLEEDRALLLEQQQNMRVVSAGSRSSSSPHTLSRGASVRRTPANTPEKSLAESEKVSIPVPMSPGFKHRPLPPATQKPKKNFRVGRPLPKWGEALPQDFFERLRLYEEESKQHMAELNERTLREIRDSLEKKLAGQHRLSKREEAMYDALKDVSLPALFMPFRSGTVFNPRAHQYFHPTGSTDLRLTQPPSMFQLPPLTKQNKLSVVNLFELSSNFSSQNQSWLMERYIQQQQPLPDGTYNQSAGMSGRVPHFLTQTSQLTDSGLDGPNSAQGNPSLPEQEVES